MPTNRDARFIDLSHTIENGMITYEHMTNLEALPSDGFRFTAVPPRVSGMGTFPVRAHARLVR